MFVFYDFETTGTSPAFDQPLQFAAILTDEYLQPIDRVNIRCRLAPHILPAPWALAVTGINPASLNDLELPTLFEFMQTIADLIARWRPATWVGYNSIAFDEEMMRQAFYQNLHPQIYLTQSAGNDRMDILKLVYAVSALAPEALEWPQNDRGQTSFKLDQLAPANGFEQHDAHDALGDVEATIFITNLIRQKAPAIWEQGLRNRTKQNINSMLESGRPLGLVERFSGPPRTYFGAFSGRNPQNTNTVGFMDLSAVDPAALADSNDETIANAVSQSPKLIRSIKVNGYPALFEVADLTDEVVNRARALSEMREFHQRVGSALAARFADRPEPEYVEEQIYSGFASESDQQWLRQFQTANWASRMEILSKLEDQRFFQLGRRIVFANQPNLLKEELRDRIANELIGRWHAENAPWTTFAAVDRQIEEIEQVGELGDQRLRELRAYYDERRR